MERGTHAQLLAAGGLYDELYRTQFAVQATGMATAGEIPLGAAADAIR